MPSSRVTLSVDLAALRANHRHIAEAVAPAQVIAVLKANAYGLGMKPIAAALADSGIAAIAVAELSEGIEAINALGNGVPVLLLGTVLPSELDDAIIAGLHIPLPDLDTARHVSKIASLLSTTAQCHIPLDTGMVDWG